MKYFLGVLFILCFGSLVAQPTNDNCEDAINLGVIPTCETTIFTNIAATASNVGTDNIPECFNGGNVENDVWFKFTIPNDGESRDFKITLAATAINGINNPQLAIFRGDCSADQLSQLGVCVSATPGSRQIEAEAIGLKTNTQYFIRINDYSATATPNWGDFTLCIETLAPFFNMGDAEGTQLCAGTLFDSGGRNEGYESDEDHTFTICPSAFHRCIAIDIETYDTEEEFDQLTIFEGNTIAGEMITTINGTGFSTLAFAKSDCITVQFTSDGSLNQSGFRLSWECQVAACPEFEETDCSNATIINNIPFEANNLTTCFAGNNVEIGPCGEDDFLSGQEYIFAYDSPGGECITLNISGIIPRTGVAIIKDCPEGGDGLCIDQKQGLINESSFSIPNIDLAEKGLYYFIIANENNCTPFDLSITPSSSCPKVFPSAAKCNNGLILNGCNPELPAALTVEPAAGDPDFFKFGVNNGCWDGVFETNYTWFTFEAQGDGDFAFLLSNNDPNGLVDIDFNIWGPFEELAEACSSSNNSQPIRSSWADDLLYSQTGLAAVNPELGTPITSTCEGSSGEGFVTPLKVKKGEIYVVLINDFDGVIFSGAVAIDFSGSDPGVLASLPGSIISLQDTFICAGNSIELNASGASIYDWSPSQSLSCRACPNPIATPSKTTTYTLSANTVCNTFQEEITIEVIEADAGDDQTVCQGAIVQLNGTTNAEEVTYQWTSLNTANNLSCTDCPDPIITTTTAGIFEYILTITKANCSSQDTMVLNIMEGIAPNYTIATDQQLCIGNTIELGGEKVDGQTYQWTSSRNNFETDEANPIVSPTVTTTYYLTISTSECSIETVDSVTIELNKAPIISVRTDTTICQGEKLLLGSTQEEIGVTYEWTTNNNTIIETPTIANITGDPTSTTIYTLTASIGACQVVDSLRIQVNPIEVNFQETGDTLQLCLGEAVALDLSVIPTNATVELSALDGSIDTNVLRLLINPAVNQTYIAKAINNSCMATDTIVVQVDSLPENMDIMPSDTSICLGTQLVMSSPIYDPKDYPNLQHQWTPDVGFDSPDSFYNLVITPSDTVILNRINRNGACVDTSIAIINVQPFIEVDISATPSMICLGETTALLADLPAGVNNITWMPSENISCTDCANPTVTPNQMTTYRLSGTYMDCPLMGSTIVDVANFEGTNLINLGATEIFIGQTVDSIILNTNLENISTIEWFENGRLITNATEPVLNYIPLANEPVSTESQTVLIEAIITTENGCQHTISTSIRVKPPTIPNVFTPGNDGVNDYFNIQLPETERTVVVFKIYNRWGKLIYDNHDPEKGWNGRLNNMSDPMPAGVYIYTIQYLIEEKMEAIKGDVTLIR